MKNHDVVHPSIPTLGAQREFLMAKADGPIADETAIGGGSPIAWPWYVRWLAVAYVFSILVGAAGFVVMLCVAGYLMALDGPAWDGPAIVAFAAAGACPLACAAYRWWFRSWGRRHWPNAEPEGQKGCQERMPRS